MVTVGDAQNGKRKVENVDNPKNFPHTKAFGRFYGAKVAAGLLVVVVGIQLINGVEFSCILTAFCLLIVFIFDTNC